MTALFRRCLYLALLLCLPWPLLAQQPLPTTPTPAVAPSPGVGTLGPPLPPEGVPPVISPLATPPEEHELPLTFYYDRTLFDPVLGLYHLFGHVTMESTYATINADELTYNEVTKQVLARGSVSITTLADHNTYFGTLLLYDVLPPNHWQFIDVAVTYPASFLGPPFIAPIFINGKNVSGLTGKPIQVNRAHFTTCDDAQPHYELLSKRVDVYPGDKVIAYQNVLVVLGHRILYLPYFFLSLRQHTTPIVPEIGENTVEGYYARFLFQYVLSPTELGGVRLDLTSIRGVGIALDHFYSVPKGAGELFLYGRQGLDEYAIRLDHYHQVLPGQITATVVVDDRRDYSVTPTQSTTNTQYTTTLERDTDHTQASFNFNHYLDEGSFSSDSTTSLLSYNSSVFYGKLESSLRYDSFGSGSSVEGSASTPELWSHLIWSHPYSFATFFTQFDLRSALVASPTASTELFSGVQRLPEVYLEAKAGADKLDNLHLPFLRQVPSTFRVGWGIFSEVANGTITTFNRYRLEWDVNQLQFTRGPTQLTGTTYLHQYVYGDPDTTALYTYGIHLSEATKFLTNFTNTLRFDRDYNNGYTPFSFDTISKLDTVADSIHLLRGKLDCTLAGGYDYLYKQWQDLTFTSQVPLGHQFVTSQQFFYDLNQHQWGDLVSQYSWFPNNRLTINLGTRYALQTGQLDQVASQVDWVINSEWHLQWHGGYNGISNQINYNEILLTRDLHCWDATVMYSESQSSYGFYLRLKALNMPLPSYGIGRGGQVLDTDLGTSL